MLNQQMFGILAWKMTQLIDELSQDYVALHVPLYWSTKIEMEAGVVS